MCPVSHHRVPDLGEPHRTIYYFGYPVVGSVSKTLTAISSTEVAWMTPYRRLVFTPLYTYFTYNQIISKDKWNYIIL